MHFFLIVTPSYFFNRFDFTGECITPSLIRIRFDEKTPNYILKKELKAKKI